MSGVSDYAAFLNNPIYRVDILGDSTAPTSTKEAALARIKELSAGLEQSNVWKNVSPSDFINDLTDRVNNPSQLTQGHGTNFCWAAACMSYVYDKNPLGMVNAMFSAYMTGDFRYDNGTNTLSISHPSPNIANEPGRVGSSFDNDRGLTNKADQMLLLMLGGGFKGYTNIDCHYDPGDQDNITWSSGVLSKAKDLWNRFGYNVNVSGGDLGDIRWLGSSKADMVTNALNRGNDVVLFINGPYFKRGQWYLSTTGTHYIRVNNITTVNNKYSISYWDYGEWHSGANAANMSPSQFEHSTFGVIRIQN